MLSFESFLSTDRATSALPVEHSTPEADLLDREQHGYLHDAVQALPARLRTVVIGSFFEDRLMADLAEELGVSESRISHMRAEAIALIREAMTRSLDSDDAAANDAPVGVAARRRAAYVEAGASASDYRSRLESRIPAAVGVPA